MSSINLGQVHQLFNQFDTDNNGLDRKELAKAALDNRVSTDLKRLAGTIALGGKDNAGYMAEMAALTTDNATIGNERISYGDFVGLAGKTGNSLNFEALDFKAIAEAKYVEGGISISVQKLQEVAGITTTPNDNPLGNIQNLLPILVLMMLMNGFNQPPVRPMPGMYPPPSQPSSINPLLLLSLLGGGNNSLSQLFGDLFGQQS